MRSHSRSSRWPPSSTGAIAPFMRLRSRGAGMVLRPVMLLPLDDEGADAGAATDIENPPGEEGGGAGREEQRGVGHALRLPQPLHRDGAGERLLTLAASRNDLVE